MEKNKLQLIMNGNVVLASIPCFSILRNVYILHFSSEDVLLD
jgi:hypothetical protein